MTSDPGPVHVHGLGLNPSDDALFVATHTGLFRSPPDGSEATRVADNYQDTMGFTVIGPDRFLGSGHPDLQRDLPPFLGLIETDDAGQRWTPVSLEGEADFHVLEAAGQRIYGFGSDFETREEMFLVSDDRGSSWKELRPPESLLSLAVNPANPDELVGSGIRRLYLSVDAGRHGRPIAGPRGLLSWPAPERLYLVDGQGEVAAADGAGERWALQGEIGGRPSAFEAAGADQLYAALHDGTIKESADAGATWSERSRP